MTSKTLIIIYSLIIILLASASISAQVVEGVVFEAREQDSIPLPGVNIYWQGSTKGTVSAADGHFSLPEAKGAHHLIFSFIGYANDTLHVHAGSGPVMHTMRQPVVLGEVEVTSRAKTAFVSRLSTLNTTHISSGELQKAACCNLSESFETSASVDVSYSDAVTGAKQIEMLGLSGIYTQMMAENMPAMRGLANSFGLTYVPGSWMESIQVSKGTSSVLNGYESVSGQINVEYKKPSTSERLFVNLYQNHMGMTEANFNTRLKLSPKLSTMLLAHGSMNNNRHDGNHDGFLDDPTGRQLNLFNRWELRLKNFESQFGIRALADMREGGQLAFEAGMPRDTAHAYGVMTDTRRAEAFLKTGFISANKSATSLGIQQQATWHAIDSYFGINDYNATQWSYYANALYQSWIGNPRHTFTTGMSFVFDRFEEQLNDSLFGRTEAVPGAFFQYTYSDGSRFNLIAGLRADHHNTYGFFFTPRLHLRFSPTEHTTLRASAGKGYRSPNVLAENISLLASSRRIQFLNTPRMEEAWNVGLNITRHIDIGRRELSLSFDAYRTSFEQQMIIDRDSDISKVLVYNLEGKSYSNSLQFEANYELFKGLDVTAAYRFNDVKMTFGGELKEKPLVNRHKALLSASYVTRLRKWQFDATWQYNGQSRLPGTESYPEIHRQPSESPAYSIFNAQVTKYFRKWDLYLGGENLSNFKQAHPLISPENPFGDHFDASMVWGPITGIKIYAGLRFRIE